MIVTKEYAIISNSPAIQFSAFMGSLSYAIITTFIGSCVTWEVIGDELFMAAKVPVAGEGTLTFGASFKIEDFEQKDMSGLTEDVFRKLNDVLLIARRSGRKTTDSSSSEN